MALVGSLWPRTTFREFWRCDVVGDNAEGGDYPVLLYGVRERNGESSVGVGRFVW